MAEETYFNVDRIVELAESLSIELSEAERNGPCLGESLTVASLGIGFRENVLQHLIVCEKCRTATHSLVKSENISFLAIEQIVLPVLNDAKRCNLEIHFVACGPSHKHNAFLDVEFKIGGALSGYSNYVFLGNGCVCVVFYGVDVSRRVKDCFINRQNVIDTVVLSCSVGKTRFIGQTSVEFLVR